MELLSPKDYSFLAKALLLGVILISVVSNLYFMGMSIDGRMVNCIFMEGGCNMTLSEHMNIWQQMFAAMTTKVFSLNFFVLIALLWFTLVYSLANVYPILFQDFIYQYRFRKKISLSIFDPIKEAFSRGILNPKIYNTVAI